MATLTHPSAETAQKLGSASQVCTESSPYFIINTSLEMRSGARAPVEERWGRFATHCDYSLNIPRHMAPVLACCSYRL